MTSASVLLAAFDHNWQHEWEALEPLLADVSAEAAAWQHDAYAREKAHGLLAAGTIA